MRIFRRPRDNNDGPAVTEFMWGVPRREGHSDTDDPKAHAGVMQHAFEFGRDDRAICGFEPPKRTSRVYRDTRPQLAVPGRDNPKCRKCELLVASRVRGDEAVPVMDPAARDGLHAETAEAEPSVEPSEETPAAVDTEPASDSAMVGAQQAGRVAAGEDEPAVQAEQTAEHDHLPDGQPAAQYEQLSVAPVTFIDERPDANELRNADSLSSIRDPGFQPRGQTDRARRRSVRRGGTVLVGSGKRSVVIEVPVSSEVAGIVANVEPEIEDVRVEAVTVGNDGTARITLNRPAAVAVEVAWYVVSNPVRDAP